MLFDAYDPPVSLHPSRFFSPKTVYEKTIYSKFIQQAKRELRSNRISGHSHSCTEKDSASSTSLSKRPS